MKSQTEKSYKERVLRVLIYIQKHLDEAIELADLAKVAHFSPYHFHRLFRGMVGESVMEHVRRLRLERAAHRLRFGDEPITGISFQAGYETHEAFTRAFRAMFGQAPSQFRDSHKAIRFPRIPSDVHFISDAQLQDFHASKVGPPPDVQVEQMASLRVAFARHVGSYQEAGKAWQTLMAWAGRKGLVRARPTMLGIVHDDPEVTPREKIRYDACLAVDDVVQADGEIAIQTIEGGEFAVTTHRGPYERLGETYARLLGQWLPASGHEVRYSPGFEMYRGSPQQYTPDELETDIYLPLSA